MQRKLFYNSISLLCGTWFVLLGWAWVYWFNILFVFPVGILGAYFWYLGKGGEYQILNRLAGIFLALGLVSSIASLFVFR